MGEILSNKKSGSSREGPQFEPKSKKSKVEFRCEKCDFVLGSQLLLNSHISEHHSGGPFTCDECNITFGQKSQREVHIIKKHKLTEGQQFNCNDCSFQGNHQTELNKHLQIIYPVTLVERNVHPKEIS